MHFRLSSITVPSLVSPGSVQMHTQFQEILLGSVRVEREGTVWLLLKHLCMFAPPEHLLACMSLSPRPSNPVLSNAVDADLESQSMHHVRDLWNWASNVSLLFWPEKEHTFRPLTWRLLWNNSYFIWKAFPRWMLYFQLWQSRSPAPICKVSTRIN